MKLNGQQINYQIYAENLYEICEAINFYLVKENSYYLSFNLKKNIFSYIIIKSSSSK